MVCWRNGPRQVPRDACLATGASGTSSTIPKLHEGSPAWRSTAGSRTSSGIATTTGPARFRRCRDGKLSVSPSHGISTATMYSSVAIGQSRSSTRFRAKDEPTLDTRVSSRQAVRARTSNFHGKPRREGPEGPVKLFGSQKVTWIDRSDNPDEPIWVDDWKVLIDRRSKVRELRSRRSSRSAASSLDPAPPALRHTSSLDASTPRPRRRYAECTSATRFVRFLVSLRKITQHATRDVYSFVPDLPWTGLDGREALRAVRPHR